MEKKMQPMKLESKFVPQGYRYLKLGEPIRKNDYFWHPQKNKWTKIIFDADTSSWVKEHVIRQKETEDAE